MGYLVKTEDDYILITMSGEYSITELENIIVFIRNRCKQIGYNKALIDNTQIDIKFLDKVDRFFIGRRIAKVLGNRVKLAVLDNQNSITYFSETIARTKIADFRIFSDKIEAMKWLKQAY